MLIVAIIVLALIGGFLGNLLEFALWAILLLAIAGAALGYFAFKSLSNRLP